MQDEYVCHKINGFPKSFLSAVADRSFRTICRPKTLDILLLIWRPASSWYSSSRGKMRWAHRQRIGCRRRRRRSEGWKRRPGLSQRKTRGHWSSAGTCPRWSVEVWVCVWLSLRVYFCVCSVCMYVCLCLCTCVCVCVCVLCLICAIYAELSTHDHGWF